MATRLNIELLTLPMIEGAALAMTIMAYNCELPFPWPSGLQCVDKAAPSSYYMTALPFIVCLAVLFFFLTPAMWRRSSQVTARAHRYFFNPATFSIDV